jgi:hypothetical protein
MSHSLSPVTIKDVPLIVEAAPFKLPMAGRLALIALIALGVVGMAIGLTGDDPKSTWAAYHVNFVYWFILSAACTCFGAVLHICNAQWSRPIKRLFESASNFFLISLILFIGVYLGHDKLFIWSHEHIAGRGPWLTSWFVYSRDFLAMMLLIYLGRKYVFMSISRDIVAIRGGLTGLSDEKLGRWKSKEFDKYANVQGSASEGIKFLTDKMGVLSPIIVIFYAIVISFFTFDQVMSVDPHWYSTLFGVLVFMSAVYIAMAWASMGVGVARELHPLFKMKIERRTLHDLGKLLFGFGIFWAYMFWSHYLPIWYGNIPEETAWMITRLREQPWHDFAWVTFGGCFIIPFLLGLSRDVKQVPVLLFLTGLIVACGIWMEIYLLFVPTIYPHQIPLKVTDIFIALGFMGGFLLSAASFLEKFPLMPVGDLYLEQEKH